MPEATIQVSYIVNIDTDGEHTVEEMDVLMKQYIRDSLVPLGMAFDTTSISNGIFTSSISGTENI